MNLRPSGYEPDELKNRDYLFILEPTLGFSLSFILIPLSISCSLKPFFNNWFLNNLTRTLISVNLYFLFNALKSSFLAFTKDVKISNELGADCIEIHTGYLANLVKSKKKCFRELRNIKKC